MKKKIETWKVIYPDKSERLFNYCPFEKSKEEELAIKELKKILIKGIVNGLSKTHQDGRLNEIDFWRKRCNLFNTFSLCVLDIVEENNYKLHEKELNKIAEVGYDKQ